MTNNPILEEIYRARAQILAEHGHALKAYMNEEFERLKAAGHPIAKLEQRRAIFPPKDKSSRPESALQEIEG